MLSYQGDGYRIAGMISNGQGPNADSRQDTKDFSLRVDSTPVKGVNVGAYGLFGEFAYNGKGRWGVDTKITALENWAFGAEYQMARDGATNGLGGMVYAAYLLTEKLQPVYRYEIVRPNVKASWVAQGHSLGVNYLIQKHNAKVQGAFSSLSNMTGGNGSPVEAKGVNGSLVTLGFQMAI